MKNKNSINFANQIMQEIGLELTPDNYVVDQDTGDLITVNGKKLKYCNEENGDRIGYTDCVFDPLNNNQLMSQLFYYYTRKLTNEARYISVVYSSSQDKMSKGTISCKEDNIEVKSDPYYKDSLKYGSLINKLNGGNDSYSDFDEPPVLNKRKRR